MIKYTAKEKKRYIETNINRINFLFKELNIRKKIEIDIQGGSGANVFITDLDGNRLERLSETRKIDQLFNYIEGLLDGIQFIIVEKHSIGE